MALYNNPYQRRFYKTVLRLLLLIIRQGSTIDRLKTEENDITEAWKLIDEL
jgi:hypothetical protein